MNEQCKVLQNLEEMNNDDSTAVPQEPQAIILGEEEIEEVIRVQKILIQDLEKIKKVNSLGEGENPDEKKDKKAREKETGSDTKAEKETQPTEANIPPTKRIKKDEKARENKTGSDRTADANQAVSNDNQHIKNENKSKLTNSNKLDIKSFLKIIK